MARNHDIWTLWLTKTDINRINRELKQNGLTTITSDDDCSGAYAINALDRLPVEDRQAVKEVIKRHKER